MAGTVDQPTLLKEISRITGRDKDKISMDHLFKGEIGMDSLQALELIVTLEEDYGIVIEQTQAASLKTPRQLLEFISKIGKS